MSAFHALYGAKAQYTVTEVVDHTQTFRMEDWTGTATNFEELRAEWLAHGEAIRDKYPGSDFIANDFATNVLNVTKDAMRAIWKASQSPSNTTTVLNWSCNSASILASETQKMQYLSPDAGWKGLYEYIITPTWADIVCKLAGKFATKEIIWLGYDREVASSDPEYVFDAYKDKWRVEMNRSMYAFKYVRIVEILKESCPSLQGGSQDTMICAIIKMVNLVFRSGYVAAEGEEEIQMTCNLATAIQYFAPIFTEVISRYSGEDSTSAKRYETNFGTITVANTVQYNGDDSLIRGVVQIVNKRLQNPIPQLMTMEYNDREHVITWMMTHIDVEKRNAYHNRLFLIGAKDAESTRNTQSLFEEFGSRLLLQDDRLSDEKRELFSGEREVSSKYIGPVNNQYGTGDHLATWEVNIPLARKKETVNGMLLKVGKGWNIGDSKTPKARIIKGLNLGEVIVDNGLTKIIWKRGLGSIDRTVRRVKEIEGLSFKVVLEDREHHLEGVENKVANLILGGCYGKGPALWLIQQIATGRLIIAESSTSCLKELAPSLSNDITISEHIDSFLPPEVSSELSVISDGNNVYSMVREDGTAMELLPGPLNTIQTSAVKLDMRNLGAFRRYRLARPRMVG